MNVSFFSSSSTNFTSRACPLRDNSECPCNVTGCYTKSTQLKKLIATPTCVLVQIIKCTIAGLLDILLTVYEAMNIVIFYLNCYITPNMVCPSQMSIQQKTVHVFYDDLQLQL
jgi:hypothetical protein